MEFVPDFPANVIHKNTVNYGICPCEIYVFKNTVSTFPGNRYPCAFNSPRIDPDQFPGVDIPDELRVQGISRYTFGCYQISILGFTDTEWLDAQRVTKRINDSINHHHN